MINCECWSHRPPVRGVTHQGPVLTRIRSGSRDQEIALKESRELACREQALTPRLVLLCFRAKSRTRCRALSVYWACVCVRTPKESRPSKACFAPAVSFCWRRFFCLGKALSVDGSRTTYAYKPRSLTLGCFHSAPTGILDELDHR